NPWCDAFHILIGVLNGKRSASFHEITQVSQGFEIIGREESLWSGLVGLVYPAPWVFGQGGDPYHFGQKQGFILLRHRIGRPHWAHRGGWGRRRGWRRRRSRHGAQLFFEILKRAIERLLPPRRRWWYRARLFASHGMCPD